MNAEERLIWGKYLSAVANSRRQELEAIDELLNELGKPIMETATKAEKPTLEEIGSLRYVDKTSDKGPYKTADKKDNPNNPAFLKLQKYLKEHNGFAVLHGFKLWSFSTNQDIIGRRKQ